MENCSVWVSAQAIEQMPPWPVSHTSIISLWEVSFLFPKNPTLIFAVPLFSLHNAAVSCSRLLGRELQAGRPGSKTSLQHSEAVARSQSCLLGAPFLHLQNGRALLCLSWKTVERIRGHDHPFLFYNHPVVVIREASAPGCSGRMRGGVEGEAGAEAQMKC